MSSFSSPSLPLSPGLRGWEALRQFFGGLRSGWPLARELAWRDIRLRYRESLMGMSWNLALPLLIGLAVAIAQQRHWLNLHVWSEQPSANLFTGLVFWELFRGALLAPSRAFKEGKSLLMRLRFPAESLLLEQLTCVLFDFGLRFAVLLIAVAFQTGTLGWGMWVTPLAGLILVMIGTGVGLVTLPFVLLFKDVERFLPRALQILVLATPVFYPLAPVHAVSVLIRWNPLSAPINYARAGLLTPHYVPGWDLAASLVIGVTLLLVGAYFYRRTVRTALDCLGD